MAEFAIDESVSSSRPESNTLNGGRLLSGSRSGESATVAAQAIPSTANPFAVVLEAAVVGDTGGERFGTVVILANDTPHFFVSPRGVIYRFRHEQGDAVTVRLIA